MGPGQAAGDVEGPRAARRLATWALGDRRASGHWHRVSLTPGGGRRADPRRRRVGLRIGTWTPSPWGLAGRVRGLGDRRPATPPGRRVRVSRARGGPGRFVRPSRDSGTSATPLACHRH